MIVKKFQAPTEMEAVMKAKEELGSSAVVLNVKNLKQRGIFRFFKKDIVEITAALEESQEDSKKSNSGNGHFNQTVGDNMSGSDFLNSINNEMYKNEKTFSPKTSAYSSSNYSNYNRNNAIPKADTEAIEQKLDSLQNFLKNKMDNEYLNKNIDGSDSLINEGNAVESQSQQAIRESENNNYKFLQLIYKKMLDNDVEEKCADSIIGDIENSLKRESNIDSILSAVYQKIILKLGEPHVIELNEGKPKAVFFIGPTGVGKTTTIAKIASKFKLEEHAKVAFITSDTYRIAAVEQLNTYASIIDCPVSVVYSADELEKCLDEYKDYDLILIDTAGRSHKAEEQMDELETLINRTKESSAGFDVEIYLTLSVTTKSRDLVSIISRYEDIDDWSVIFTKLDETSSLGNVLNIRMYTDAPLSYTTIGQNVPDDIEVIDKQAVAKQLLGGAM